MNRVSIFWDPTGQELDTIGNNKYERSTDGDTPYISMAIRMLSIDAPETHYPGTTKPSKQDMKFLQLAEWINQGKAPVTSQLAVYLYPKLKTGKAGTLQEEQGRSASDYFRKLIEEKLRLKNGKFRSVFVRSSNEHFDSYGRLLAYIAPKFTSTELANMTRADRATFNLMMIEKGWASPFPIYPSLPQYEDLVLLRDSGKKAVDTKIGIWKDKNTLTGYEFRMCVKLFEVTQKLVEGKKLSTKERNSWIERYCVDMKTRQIFYPKNYTNVKVYDRIFIWPKDVRDAVGKMNLIPG